MGKEYLAKVFKSGNSVALRLPKALGLRQGAQMSIREEQGSFIVEPSPREPGMINLEGIYGSVPRITRPPLEDNPRDYSIFGPPDD